MNKYKILVTIPDTYEGITLEVEAESPEGAKVLLGLLISTVRETSEDVKMTVLESPVG